MTSPRQPRRKSDVLPLEFSEDEKATAKTREYAKMMQCEQFEKIGLLPHFAKQAMISSKVAVIVLKISVWNLHGLTFTRSIGL